MMTSFLIMLAAGAAEPVAVQTLPIDPTRMSRSEIRASNAGRSANDPDYIRCVRADETGSLVKKTVSCHTNSQWAEADLLGNDNARSTFGAMQSKAGNNSN